MEDKLKSISDGIQQTVPEVSTYNNYGKGVQVGHADTFSPTVNLIITGSNGQQRPANTDYYNLFIGFDPFISDHLLVPKDRALTEYMTPELKSRFASLDDNAIADIKRFPSIIVDEYCKTTPSEKNAVFAFVTDVRKQQNGVMVYFRQLYPIPVKVLLENEYALDTVNGYESFRTHWAIKNINLIQVLQDAGVAMWG
ncbi:hypothetical protein [Clostridium sp. KNHs216]|jgi:hypothetical protein|uniref:hypothetical protein n=1 Tax=Clostridium sp. KNHs216 TaxID=1550235 RepID=UPI001152F893|nr:hypothetical protein [Clostridium sp. KNHs216]NLC74044.1 hypothetical protein [Clostridiales bacterium]TQI67342.1 hypothetical protein LY85_2030 [Clostridium sp. KNHs216]